MLRTNTAVVATLLALFVVAGCEMIDSKGQIEQREQSQQRADQKIREANDFLEQGMLDSALAAFGLALEENPRLTEAHMGMGDVYRELGDYEKASEAFERAVESDPSSDKAHYSLGLMRQLLGKVKEAIASYLRALTIDPDNFEANRDLASAYLQLGKPGDALPYAERAIDLNGDDQAAWANLAATYSLLNRYEDAVDAYRQAAEAGELNEPLLLGLVDAHIKLGNYELAINVLRRLVSETPSSTAHERYGYALFKMRRVDDALAQYQSALEIDNEDTAALNGRGACLMTRYIQGGREDSDLRQQALDAWRTSVRIDPKQSRIVDLLARYSRL